MKPIPVITNPYAKRFRAMRAYTRAVPTPFESYRDAEGAMFLMEYKAFSAEECV